MPLRKRSTWRRPPAKRHQGTLLCGLYQGKIRRSARCPTRSTKGGSPFLRPLSYDLQQAAEASHRTGVCPKLRSECRPASAPNKAPQAALVALDIETGGILSMVGGRSAGPTSFNRATNGTTAAGIGLQTPGFLLWPSKRGFEQSQTLLDAPVIFHSSPSHQDWQPRNFSNDYSGEISLRWALMHSRNIPSGPAAGENRAPRQWYNSARTWVLDPI